jgi:oxaloacetate decarboxylase gamma subunit
VITQGIELMLIGMGVVFAFLILLVGAIHLAAALFARFGHLFPDPESEPKPSAPGLPKSAADPSTRLAVALAAAHRARRSH